MRIALIPIACLLGCYGPAGAVAQQSPATSAVVTAAKPVPPSGGFNVADANGVTLGKLIPSPYSNTGGTFMSWIDASNIIWVFEFGDPNVYFFTDPLWFTTPDCTGTPYENFTPPIANIGLINVGQAFRSTGMRTAIDIQSIKYGDGSCGDAVTTISAAPVVSLGVPAPSMPALPLSIVPAS